jgi:CubicO group peptidase (beta-lactamase class C family)
VGQLISHQGGLSGFMPPQTPEVWFDRIETLNILCAQTPLWPVGQGSGYHPITGGYILGEVFRRIDGRSMGQALHEDLSLPFGLDIFLGTPESEWPRIADLQKPTSPPDLGLLDDIKRSAFLDKGSAPQGRGSGPWRIMEIPSANIHATALALAELMAIVASGGWLKDKRLMSLSTLAQATRERVYGQDRVLPFKLSWAAGFLRNRGLGIYGPNERAIGHSGWGGSCVMADPERKLSIAYVMNRQSSKLIGDPRPLALIETIYACF